MKKKNGLKLRLNKETVRVLEQVGSPELAAVAGGCGATNCGCGGGGGGTFLCSDSICVNACP